MTDLRPPAALAGKRIAILSHSHVSVTKGGAEIAAHGLFRGLRAIGVDAILIACCDDAALDRIELGPNEFALPYRGALYDHFYHLAPAGVRQDLIDLLRRERIDVLNAHHFLHTGIGVFEDVAAAGIEIVYTIHEFLSICHNHGQLVTRGTDLLCEGASPGACHACYPEHSRQQFAVRSRHVARSFGPVAAFVSPSRFLAGKMTANGVPQNRMHVIENGVAGGVAAVPADRSSEERLWTFGYFGQINPFKGIDLILDACAILARDEKLAQRIRVAIHGNIIGHDGDFMDRFTAAIAGYPFLSYLGPYDNSRVGGLMARCDYVLMPSRWWENSPVVIQESFHARRPVICTGIGGMAEKVTDRVNGLHFARGDAGDLARRIVEGADPALYERLQSGIPQTVSLTSMAAKYAALFASVTPAE
ncbi:glycosyltransferase [Sphingomonas sp. SUN019]|uniref:glycosyltransferase n=1 Tax=Sphingomonas sp. SUN019 TaxID=2937788 RepID=UPI00216475BF|nr:glycosyltransferase [Sphingomonas sp. SUN019]UVO48992.1 glycosyltransferase [Sphingomonas sp. SUN019]